MSNPLITVLVHIEQGLIQSIKLSPASKNFSLLFTHEKPHSIENWFLAYLDKKPYPLSLDLGSLSSFERKVLNALSNIEFGQTISYAELACKIGKPKAARAVGNALNKNPFPLIYPCHRIILQNGKWGGYQGGSSLKKELLQFETS